MAGNLKSVLLEESIEALNINPEAIYVDATLGGGGHSKLILENLTKGHLYAFDQDEFAIKKAKEKLSNFDNLTIIHSNFENLKKELNKLNVTKIDGILMDLGMSSFQIDDETRGFTYLKDVSLDMRMNKDDILTAKEILNTYSFEDLSNIFFHYGDEENSFKIASEVIKQRPLETTFDLVNITDRINYKRKGHTAKKVFQALRIAVNNELGVLESLLEQSLSMLNENGRIAAITFHSLEDKIVKHFFKKHSTLDIPKDVILFDGQKADLKVVNRKPIYPSKEELDVNSRSRSAKLRIAEKN